MVVGSRRLTNDTELAYIPRVCRALVPGDISPLAVLAT
jgi:hypothetical protein